MKTKTEYKKELDNILKWGGNKEEIINSLIGFVEELINEYVPNDTIKKDKKNRLRFFSRKQLYLIDDYIYNLNNKNYEK